MGEIVADLKSNKIRTIEINQSEKNNNYVERCFKDISTIPKFHYKDKNSVIYNHCYFGCVIAKKPIYLFVDAVRNKIVVYDVKSKVTSYVPESDYDAVKKILLNSKSATYYINRNTIIKNLHKAVWVILLIMSCFLLFAYCTNKFDDGRFGTIALNIMVVMALQDCINVYTLRFERKHYDKFLIFLATLECVALLAGFATFLVPGAYDAIGRYNNMISIALTMGTILVKFDKPRGND